jgi:hypothetical protein
MRRRNQCSVPASTSRRRVQLIAGFEVSINCRFWVSTEEIGAELMPPLTSDNPLPMRLSPTGPAGFPQIYVLDPDHNVIEINAAKVD